LANKTEPGVKEDKVKLEKVGEDVVAMSWGKERVITPEFVETLI
jgi:hypothetical protein